MKKIDILLSAIIIAAVLTMHAFAADKFFIYVYDKDGKAVQDASIEIWNGGDRIDKGFTDVEGKYPSWLDTDTKYRITAKKDDQSTEWNDFPNAKSHKIELKFS